VIQMNGVLSSGEEGTSFVARKANPRGLAMVRALSESFRVVLTTRGENLDHVNHWIRTNGLEKFVSTMPSDHSEVEKIHKIRAMGSFIAFYISADKNECVEVLRAGFPVMHYADPVFTYSEWRPDAELLATTPWEDISAELTMQKNLKDEYDATNEDDDEAT